VASASRPEGPHSSSPKPQTMGHIQEPSVPPANPYGEPSYQRSASNVDRLTARISGLPDPQREATREELLEAGVPPQQADAITVRQNEVRFLSQHFLCWVFASFFITCLFVPVLMGFLIWLALEYDSNKDTKCGSPLATYAIGLFVINVFSIFGRSLVQCCCSTEHGCDPQKIRSWLGIFVTGALFIWNCLGLHWVVTDSADPAKGLDSCSVAAPGLYHATKAYSITSIIFTLFVCLNLFGVVQILRLMVRHGLLRTNQAAPPGSMERNTESVNEAALMAHVRDNPSCPICLDEYRKGAKDAVRMKKCGHVFHKQCLQKWMNVNRTCPLCREDLGA